MSRVALHGSAVAKRFGRVAALRGIDFEIAAGDAVAILGANGAGKSTLLRILAGLSRASEGVFEARRRSDDSHDGRGEGPDGGAGAAMSREALRGEIGYVGHATLLYGELTATENLAFAARLAGAEPSVERLVPLLDAVGLADEASRRAGTFSRGMAQRLAIARAIVHDPSILLLDEPFTGLDEVSAERLSAQLVALRAGGRSLVVVTHDPRRAVELADRALILHRGEIVARPGREPAASGAPAAAPGGGFDADALRALLSEIAVRARREAA